MESLPLRMSQDDHYFDVDEQEYLLQPTDGDLYESRSRRIRNQQRRSWLHCFKFIFCG